MTIETLLLAAYEMKGFVGKTRVPMGQSDVDALAIHPEEGKVLLGEAKVREGSQKLYIVDDWNMAEMKKSRQDFAAWLMGDESGWAKWLHNLPKLWDAEGKPQVPWLFHGSQVKEIEVVFCCNLVVKCDPEEANDALQRAAARFLRTEQNALVAKRVVDSLLHVKARVLPTVELIFELISAVFQTIDAGYGRRFADPCRDMFREVHRYLYPSLDRLVYDKDGKSSEKRKKKDEEEIQKKTLLSLLDALGIGRDKQRELFQL
jgi:hypothetical protein